MQIGLQAANGMLVLVVSSNPGQSMSTQPVSMMPALPSLTLQVVEILKMVNGSKACSAHSSRGLEISSSISLSTRETTKEH